MHDDPAGVPTGRGSTGATARGHAAAAPPDSPGDLTRRTWVHVLRTTVREYQRDQGPDLAAALTYWSVFAIAPAALALVSLLGVIGDAEQIVERLMSTIGDLAPGLPLDQVEEVVVGLTSQTGAGFGLVTGLLVALWSASGYVNAFSRAMNRMYGVPEGRPFWKLRPLMLLVTLVVLLLVALVCVALVLTGPVAAAIGGAVGLSDAAVTVWGVAKWPVVAVLVAVVVAVLYHATPNVRPPKLRWVSVGSVVALVVWALATAGFGLYVSLVGQESYQRTYGAIGGLILFLLWLWITNNALLFGGELDAELERGRQLQAGIAAEEQIQLAPRDTTASRKKDRALARDVAAGRALRLSRGTPHEPAGASRDGERDGGGDPEGRERRGE